MPANAFLTTVCKTVRPMLSNRCLSCPVCLSCLSSLSLTLVYRGQTVGWLKMKLGMQVGLGLGHIVLYGYPPPKGAQPPIFGPCMLWPNSCIYQDTTRYVTEVGLSLGNIVSDRDPGPPPLKGHSPLIFGQCPLWPNGWMD